MPEEVALKHKSEDKDYSRWVGRCFVCDSHMFTLIPIFFTRLFMFISELRSKWEHLNFWGDGMKFQAQKINTDNSLYSVQIIVKTTTILDPQDTARQRTLEGFKIIFRSHKGEETATSAFTEDTDEGLMFFERLSQVAGWQMEHQICRVLY